MARRASLGFSVLMAFLAAFMWMGDEWLGAPSTDPSAGPVRTLWDVWIGFPPGLAHGVGVFLAGVAAWNVVSFARQAPRPSRARPG